jgi:hypothetical protein
MCCGFKQFVREINLRVHVIAASQILWMSLLGSIPPIYMLLEMVSRQGVTDTMKRAK